MNWKTIYRHNFSHSFSLQKPPSRIFFFATRKFWKYLVQFFLVGFSSFLLSDYTSLLTNPIFLSKNSSLAKVMMKKEKKTIKLYSLLPSPYSYFTLYISVFEIHYSMRFPDFIRDFWFWTKAQPKWWRRRKSNYTAFSYSPDGALQPWVYSYFPLYI